MTESNTTQEQHDIGKYQRIALTFGECGENHHGNQELGKKGEAGTGFKTTDLLLIKQFIENKLGNKCDYYDLGEHLKEAINKGKAGKDIEWPTDAGVLVIRNFIKSNEVDGLFNEILSYDWDSKYLCTRRKKVLNKWARKNLVFVDGMEQEPQYELGKGRVVDILKSPQLKVLKNRVKATLVIPLYNKSSTKDTNYIIEGNYYYDFSKCGIGLHGDAERRRVACVSLGGENYPMVWVWYYRNKPITDLIEVKLNSGDLYIMSEKAVGTDWKRSVLPTLRHGCGAYKYRNIDKYNN